MEMTREKMLHMYREMKRMRVFEETCATYFAEGKLQGFLHLGTGEEGMEGVIVELRKDDYVCSTHRGHGVTLLKGADIRRMFAELAGRSTGLSKGRGGSMHMGDLSLGILGSNGILGAGAPIMTGAGLGIRVQGRDSVAVCFFGDGQSNEGGVHEAMNFASALKLPVLFVCTNNLYGMWTAFKDVSANPDVAARAEGYGMPGVVVDGNDVLAVNEVAVEAIARARRGDGPTLIEMKTYRWHLHSEGMPENFRTKEEIAYWKEKCPIKRLREVLLRDGAEEAELDAIDAEVDEEMKEGIEYAMESPFPDLSAAYEGVYTNLEVEVDRA